MSVGIYIQVPFCQAKCTYCNFHTGVFSRALYAPYVDAVCAEIAGAAHDAGKNQGLTQKSATQTLAPAPASAMDAAPADGATAAEGLADTANSADAVSAVDTVYLGGGTPSLLESASLQRLLGAVQAAFLCDLREVTLEADPETVTPAKAAEWRAIGINRISLGAQSFHDLELRAAGRRHRRADIFAALRSLRQSGLNNLSLDLIAGLPQQTASSWQASLQQVLELAPQHLSIYILEIDEGSRLGREALAQGARYGVDALPDDDATADFYELACEWLARAGYDHYEISNWACTTQLRSRHNLKYWRRDPYIGFGAGAHSFDGRARWSNQHDPAQYVAVMQAGQSPRQSFEPLSGIQALDEEFFLGLRLLEGVDLERIERQYGTARRDRLEKLRAAGLVELDAANLRLVRARLAIANEVFVELLG